MLDITNKEDYLNGSVHKNLIIELEDGSTISNKNILTESMSISEILMEDNQLRFGRCNANEFTITLASIASNIKDTEIKVYTESNNKRLQLGVYTVNYVENVADKAFKQIIALDNMHKIDRDVTEWYQTLSFPMTHKAFRNSFFSYVGIEQVSVTLPFDDLVINDPFGNMVFINGRIIAEGICELNGRFGHCNREGKFDYIKLNTTPSENQILNLGRKYINCSYDDFVTQTIDRVIIIDEYGTQVATSDTGNNAYVINNNYLLYGKTVDELRTLGNKFLNLVKDVVYTPFTMENRGLPYVELGDAIQAVTKRGEFNSFIFRRTLRGIQALRDTYSAEGEEYLVNDLNSFQQKIDEANRHTERTRIELTSSIEGLKSTVTSVETIANEANKNANQALDNIDISATAEGNPITVTDSGNYPFIEFKEDGYIEQKTLSGNNLFSYEKSVSGYLTGGNTGGITSATAAKERTSEYINVENMTELTFQVWATPASGSYIWWAYEMYDSNKELTLNRVANQETSLGSGALRHVVINITIPEGTTYIRVSARLFSDGKIQLEKGSTATDYEDFCGGIPSPNSEYPQRIDGLGDKGYFDGKLLQGYYYPGTGIVNNANMVVSNNYIPCNENDIIELIYEETIERADYDVFSIVFFDSNKTYISRFGSGSSAKTFSTTAPTNAKYFLFDIRQDTALTPTTAKHISVTINGNYAIPIKTTNKNIFGGIALANALKNSGSTTVVVDEEAGTVQFGHNTNYKDTVNRVLFDKFKENTQYTFIFKGVVNSTGTNSTWCNTNLRLNYTDGTTENFNLRGAIGDAIDIVFTTPMDKTIASIYYGYAHTDIVTYNYNECGVFEGVITEAEFEPYQSSSANIPIETPLYEGDYIERFADGSGQLVRKRKKLQPTTVSRVVNTTYLPYTGAISLGLDYCLNNKTIVSNYFVPISGNAITNGMVTAGGNKNNAYGEIYFKIDGLTTVAEYQAWLDEHSDLEFVYELTTPIITPLTAEQLDEIEKLYTFESTTNVFANSNTYIRYYRNNANADIITQANQNVLAKAQSSITQTADEIKLEVSKRYSTKEETTQAKDEAISTASDDATAKANNALNSANTNTDNKLKNYSTTVEMNSAITQSANEIKSIVSTTYATQESVKATTDNLQQQIDGAIETFTGSVVPTLSNTPAKDWTTTAIRDTHIGDLYIVNSSGGDYAGFYYRFEKSGTTYKWTLLKDTEVTKALQDAKEANEKADANATNIGALTAKVTKAESSITQNAEKIELKVSKDDIISTINQSAEEVKIQAEKIKLEGYTSINEGIQVLEDGSVLITKGRLVIDTPEDDQNSRIGLNSTHSNGDKVSVVLFPNYIQFGRFNTDDSVRSSDFGDGILYLENSIPSGENTISDNLSMDVFDKEIKSNTITRDANGEVLSETVHYQLDDEMALFNVLAKITKELQATGGVKVDNGLVVNGGLTSNNSATFKVNLNVAGNTTVARLDSSATIHINGISYLNGGVKVNANGTEIKFMRCGSAVVNMSGSSVVLLSLATIQSWYSSAGSTNTAILVSNGDGTANGTHVQSVTYQNSNWYVVADKDTVKTGSLRVNYTVICW